MSERVTLYIRHDPSFFIIVNNYLKRQEDVKIISQYRRIVTIIDIPKEKGRELGRGVMERGADFVGDEKSVEELAKRSIGI